MVRTSIVSSLNTLGLNRIRETFKEFPDPIYQYKYNLQHNFDFDLIYHELHCLN